MNITEQAQSELKKALDSFNKPGSGIHLYSIQGCCGPSIQMDIARQVNLGETIVSIKNIDFFVSNDLLDTIENMTIDYGVHGFRLEGIKQNSGCC